MKTVDTKLHSATFTVFTIHKIRWLYFLWKLKSRSLKRCKACTNIFCNNHEWMWTSKFDKSEIRRSISKLTCIDPMYYIYFRPWNFICLSPREEFRFLQLGVTKRICKNEQTGEWGYKYLKSVEGLGFENWLIRL